LNAANPAQNVFEAGHVGDLDVTAAQGAPKLDPAEVDLDGIMSNKVVKRNAKPFDNVLSQRKGG
jgi:hypothetical protein